MGFSFREQGNYDRITHYLNKLSHMQIMTILHTYGEKGVNVLKSNTPTRSGKTAESWRYEIKHEGDRYSIDFLNSNINRGVNIAMILDVGHGTGTGGWVEGRDYISPALQPIMDNLVNELWREVSTL